MHHYIYCCDLFYQIVSYPYFTVEITKQPVSYVCHFQCPSLRDEYIHVDRPHTAGCYVMFLLLKQQLIGKKALKQIRQV